MLRKKGHTCIAQPALARPRVRLPDRPAGEERGIDPRDLEKEIRALGWMEASAVYTISTDWFVHARGPQSRLERLALSSAGSVVVDGAPALRSRTRRSRSPVVPNTTKQMPDDASAARASSAEDRRASRAPSACRPP